MSTRISDENFMTPAQINVLPCVSADRYLNKIEEEVTVLRCCLDPNDTSLVIIDFSLAGAFLFTPYCKILEVDGTSYEEDNIFAPILEEHPSCSSLPIDTNCGIFHSQLVYDFSAVISNFPSALEIKFELGMVGTVPQAYGITFPSQTPIHQFTWRKGVSLKPINISHYNGNLSVIFQYQGNIECSCNIQCVAPSGVVYDIKFCPDESRELIFATGDLNGHPQNLTITLVDSLGNNSSLSIQGLLNVNVSKPILVYKNDPKRVEVSINRRSLYGDQFNNVEYQVIKYRGNSQNYEIWKDWCDREWNTFIDTDIIEGNLYGYAVRYRGKFLDVTNLSDWAIVSI